MTTVINHYMSRETLINSCRLYKGEKECPYTMDEAIIWSVEEYVVNNSEDLSFELRQYNAAGLSDFNEDDGVPIVFKAALFNRWEHWTEAPPERFKRWYLENYASIEP